MAAEQPTEPGGPSDEAPLVSPFQAATRNLQAAARWIVTALAGVGGVLVAGIPLTGLGKVSGADIFLAFGSLFAALLAIVTVIPFVARVFTTPYVTLAELAEAEIPTSKRHDTSGVTAIVEKIYRSREELFADQAEDLGVLHSRLKAANGGLRWQRGGRRVDLESGGLRHVALAEPTDVQRGNELRATAERVLDFANYEATRRIFVGLYRKLAFAGLVTAVGVSVYAWTVNRPSASVQITTPRPVVLSLPPESVEAKRLGRRCDVRQLAAVAVEGTIRTPIVSTVPSSTCAASTFRVPKGTVVVPAKDLPVIPTPKPS